jgi:resuscitation-promoting factor RpfC
MTFTSIAVGGVAKTLMAVTISLHPGAAKHPGDYVVQSGDTLSSISQHQYGTAADWPALWWINRGTVRDPDVIRAGQRLQLSGRPAVTSAMISAAMAASPHVAAAPAPDPAPASVSESASESAPVAQPATEAPAPAAASYSGAPGSFQSCVIQAESGGNASAVNPSSGAGGLYQFLPSTWQALGFSGLPQDASVAEQNAAFAKEYAESGTSAWGPYDGC